METFEAAIEQTDELLNAQAEGTLSLDQLADEVSRLVQTSNGARGFFVSWLTGKWAIADLLPDEIVVALGKHPQDVAELLTKNLAMSTAMIQAHRERKDEAAAAGSELTARRSAALIVRLALPQLTAQLVQLRQSLDEPGGPYGPFLERWGYTNPQKEAIRRAVERVLG